ncbi:alcohol dehydrogenase catalytic domain-containing protein [Paraburkholderia youngii]|uniref:alcohol dehydrogenase catalytic domain-containing protein n=1 Tax=Paraburkholderia youngii TaxID=2782701 RepID=UPI003D255496
MLLAPVHPSDLRVIRGRFASQRQPELPASPGSEGVGIIDAVGNDVPARGQESVSSCWTCPEPGESRLLVRPTVRYLYRRRSPTRTQHRHSSTR